MDFKIDNISLGEVKSGTLHKVYFPYSNIREIIKMMSPCDCSTPVDEPNQSRIMVKYIAGKISRHLAEKGIDRQAVKKAINVTYICQSTGEQKQKELYFTAIVVK